MLGLAGCAGQPAADPATSTAPAAVNTTSAPSAASAAGIPPKPDEATVKAYLDELRAIDPAIVDEDNPDKAINRGRDQCSSVQSFPADQAKLIDLTNKRFTAPGQSNGFGPEKAERILAAVRKHICPTF
ncbi:hypothetical protein [Lentzea albida]|nr:hypothetical protein [Lentzea albida]